MFSDPRNGNVIRALSRDEHKHTHMSMKEIVTALCATQPLRGVVTSMARSSLGRRLLTGLNPRRGLYESFADAWKAAAKKRHAGHEHLEAVERHVPLAAAPMPSDYAVLYWLNRIKGDIRLFDYGGNMGNVYFGCARYIATSTRSVEWTVYDLPKVIDQAKKLASQRSTTLPRFTTSIDDAAPANVLLVSGMYHYWEKDTQSFLEQFPNLPEHVFINRSPFYEDHKPVVAMQATLNFAFPIIIRNVHELLDGFAAKGYEVVDRWRSVEYGHVMPFFPAQSVQSYSGLYFRLKAQPATKSNA